MTDAQSIITEEEARTDAGQFFVAALGLWAIEVNDRETAELLAYALRTNDPLATARRAATGDLADTLRLSSESNFFTKATALTAIMLAVSPGAAPGVVAALYARGEEPVARTLAELRRLRRLNAGASATEEKARVQADMLLFVLDTIMEEK